MEQQNDNDCSAIGKISLYVQNPNGAKCQYLIKKREKNRLYNLQNPKALIEYSNNMQDVYKNIEEHNPGRNCNVLIDFDDMIADIISNKKLKKIVTELIIYRLNISTVFTTQPYLAVPKMLD